MEHETLATELLKEIKTSARRWFIAFCIMCGLELCTIGGFIWYATLPVEEYEYVITQDTDADNGSRTLQIIDGDYNGETNEVD